jgi:hypothetical protein
MLPECSGRPSSNLIPSRIFEQEQTEGTEVRSFLPQMDTDGHGLANLSNAYTLNI